MEARDMELFIKAKKNTLIPNILTGLAAMLICSIFILEFMSINHDLTVTILTWAMVLYFTAFGVSKWAYVPREELINIIERQINNDSDALEYLANKSSEKSVT